MSCRFFQTIHREHLGLRFIIFVWITTFPLTVYRAQIADGPRKRRKKITKGTFDAPQQIAEIEKIGREIAARPEREEMEEIKVRSRVTFEEQPPQTPQHRVHFRFYFSPPVGRSDGDSDGVSDEHMLPRFQTYKRSPSSWDSDGDSDGDSDERSDDDSDCLL